MTKLVNLIQCALLAFLIASCGGESKKSAPDKAPAKPGAAAAALSGDAGAALEAASDKLRKLAHDKARTDPKKPRKVTRAQRTAFHRHLRAGRNLQKQKKWREAMAALNKALAIFPTSDRALSELSWSAFKAGDFARAETAARASVTYAIDPRVKAASLFNLGRALEKRGDKPGAVAVYQRSLRLRPNRIVKKRLVGLGGKVPKLVQTPPCSRFQTTKQLCACMRTARPGLAVERFPDDPNRFQGVCDAANKVTGGLEIVFVGVEDTTRSRTQGAYVLTRVKGNKRAVIAWVSEWVHQSYKYEDRAKLGAVEAKTIAGRRVLRVEVAEQSFIPDDYAQAMGWKESTGEDWLYFCVENDGFLKCPVQVPTFRLFTARLLNPEDKDAFTAEYGTSPVRRGGRMNVTLGKDGSVTVRHASGEKEPSMMRHVGTKRLW